MREESHLDDMRSAIRGDFERLAERRGDQELMRVDAGPKAATVAAAETEDVEPEHVEPEIEQEPQLDPEPPPRRSWLARFLGL